MREKTRVLAVVGPTASGKTALAVELAQRFDGEVVSADSMQIYKGMNIATAKPTAAEMGGIPHHLIDYVEPDEPFSLGRYVSDAHRAIAEIAARGKLPVLAGGTGLYLDTVLENRDLGEAGGNETIRAELNALAEEQGGGALLERLREVDPETAAILHENNRTRIIRALEVFRTTGQTMAELQRKSREPPARYDCCRIGIAFHDRQLLYQRIDRRVDNMMAAGLLEEARAFYESGKKTAAQAIGYKELKPFLDGECSLAEALEQLKRATRHYAKRQLTWFRREERIQWVWPDGDGGADGACANAVAIAKQFLAE